MATKYTKMPTNIPIGCKIHRSNGCKIHRANGHKIYQHLPLQDPVKLPKFGYLVLKFTIWQPWVARDGKRTRDLLVFSLFSHRSTAELQRLTETSIFSIFTFPNQSLINST
jgi:hypothetical protein